jgi:hypothetical protein
MVEKSNVGFWEGIMNPERLRVEEYKKKQQTIDPYQQLMATKYLEQNPGADFSASPGYAAIQAQYQKKLLDQGGPLYQKKTDEEGNVRYSPKKGAKEKLDKEKAQNPIVMGDQGFEPMTAQKRKDQVFGKIQEKRQLGQPITNAEANYEKKYLGVKDTKDLPESSRDIHFARLRAKDLLKASFISEGGSEANVPAWTEDQIQEIMPEVVKMYWPNADPEQIDKKDYSIQLPEGMNKLSKIREYLSEYLDGEEEINAWITENLEPE